MKQYFLKAASAITILALFATATFAQDDKKEKTEKTEKTTKHSDDVIVIRPKTDADTKLTIEIKGDNVTINGKPLSEYKNDDINISRHKELAIQRLAELDAMPRTRFRGGATVYNSGDMVYANTNKAFLGVGSEKSEDGITITSISDNSGADKAGLKEGDVITKINDIKIGSPDELTKTIGKFNPEDKITITYKRDKKEQKTTATLGKRKMMGAMGLTAPQAYEFKNFNLDNGSNYNFSWNGKPKLGLKAQETEDGKGLKVLDIDDESAAEKAGIKEGDIITSFDGTEVNNIEKLGELAKAAIEKGAFKVKLTRDGKQQEVDVKIPKKLKTTSL